MKNVNALSVGMSTELPPAAPDEAIAVCVFKDDPASSGARGEVLELIERLARDGDFKGEEETSILIHAVNTGNGGGVRRLLISGLGARRDDDDLPAFSRAVGAAVRQARAAQVKHLRLILPTFSDERRLTRAASEGAYLGLYENDFYRNSDDDEGGALERLTIIVAENSGELGEEAERGRIVAESVNWARALADE
ncbi:MAG: M17 family peptidase N-terminal domain-containing protein, partial [Pyrinomonadaceae bacterium]